MFLPPYGDHQNGNPYHVINSDYHGRIPHMNYYHPPKPRGEEVFIQALMSMFHPNAFVNCRFGPRGTVAAVRAENEKYFDIVIRSLKNNNNICVY